MGADVLPVKAYQRRKHALCMTLRKVLLNSLTRIGYYTSVLHLYSAGEPTHER